jgi:serine phosphatase RsbU (regulator of sigma subunit)
VVYIFSDGYADQFGGPRGKKFLYRRFRELLVEIHGMPMERQKIMLLEALNQWKGAHEQVDDILVIGMRA